MNPTPSQSVTRPLVCDALLEAMVGWRDREDQGDASRLVRELSPLMHRVALHSLPCAWMAEDAVQTAWMKLFRSLEKFDARVPLSAWAVMIVKGVCSNMLRSLARHPMAAWDELNEQDTERAVSSGGGELRLQQRERLRFLLEAVSKLNGTDRLIVTSFLLDGHPPAVVAKRTGLSAGAVRTRACRIRSRLRRSARMFGGRQC